MAAVHILIFGEMAGFKIVPFIAAHMKMIFFFFHGAMKKKFSANQNSPICMKTTDIKLFPYSASSPQSPDTCLLMDKFTKLSPKAHFCEIISKSDQPFQGR